MTATQSRTLANASLSTFGKLPCAQCGAGLIAPVWSEYVDETQVRHLWNCDDCSYQFETQVFFSAGSGVPQTVPSLLVA